MYNSVKTKKDFVKRYAKGEFGNAAPTWFNLHQFQAFGERFHNQLIHIRNRVAEGKTWYNVLPKNLPTMWERAVSECGFHNLYLSAMAPTECTLIQGEVQVSVWGLDLYYTCVKLPMRDALAEWSNSVNGIMAYSLLQDYLCQRSYEWLGYLLEEYSNHVVEFSTYSKQWGTVDGYNTVFWEVRNY